MTKTGSMKSFLILLIALSVRGCKINSRCGVIRVDCTAPTECDTGPFCIGARTNIDIQDCSFQEVEPFTNLGKLYTIGKVNVTGDAYGRSFKWKHGTSSISITETTLQISGEGTALGSKTACENAAEFDVDKCNELTSVWKPCITCDNKNCHSNMAHAEDHGVRIGTCGETSCIGLGVGLHKLLKTYGFTGVVVANVGTIQLGDVIFDCVTGHVSGSLRIIKKVQQDSQNAEDSVHWAIPVGGIVLLTILGCCCCYCCKKCACCPCRLLACCGSAVCTSVIYVLRGVRKLYANCRHNNDENQVVEIPTVSALVSELDGLEQA